MEKEDTKSKLDENDLNTVKTLLIEVESWLLDEDRSKSDYDNKMNEVNGIIQPIMMKVMGQGTEGFSANEAVVATGDGETDGMGVGPTIDEVD